VIHRSQADRGVGLGFNYSASFYGFKLCAFVEVKRTCI
jgi:hypothetical protein